MHSSNILPSDIQQLGAQFALDSLKLVIHLNVFLLLVFLTFATLNSPRVLARLRTTSEWGQGLFLHSVRLDPRTLGRRPSERSGKSIELSGGDSVNGEDKCIYQTAHPTQEKPIPNLPASYPHHAPSCLVLLRGTSLALERRIAPGRSLKRVALLWAYVGVLTYATFHRSNPAVDPVRTGFISVSQLPLVFALATKNNLLGLLVGKGYEKLNYMHRFAGRAATIAANIHALSYLYQYAADGTVSAHFRQPRVAWGAVALSFANILAFLSPVLLERAYTTFANLHIVSVIILIPALCTHSSNLTPWMLVVVGIYAVDHVLRVLKTRITTASISPVPELDVTRIEVPSLNAGWRAGQHVRIRVLSFGMGWLGWQEVHPFTIASIDKGPEGMVLMCKKRGTWTSDLYEMAKAAGYEDQESAGGKVPQTNVTVAVEGPYGGPGHTVIASYSAAMFAVGGSGITFALAAIQDLIEKDLNRASRVKVIDLVWVVPDAASLAPLYPLFTSLMKKSVHTAFQVTVHYTRASKTRHGGDSFPGISLVPGRPRFGKVLESVIARASALGAGEKDAEAITGIFFGVCGPVSLRDEVADVVRGVDAERREKVGGVELFEEVFGW